MYWIQSSVIWGRGDNGLIPEIHGVLSQVLKDRSLDWRTCFTDVRVEPPEGSRIVVECSDREVLEDVGQRLSGWAAGEGMTMEFVGLPDPKETFPEVLVAAGSVADVRRSSAHSAELLTQIVCGDAVRPLKTAGDWVLVRLDDGYVGWVRSWHLKGITRHEQGIFAAKARHRVRENVVQIHENPDSSALAVAEAVVGTPVVAATCPIKGWRRATLPDGNAGYVRSRSLEKKITRSPVSRESLAVWGLRFLGIPYVWGGTTPKGFDCSGLVQRIFRLHGVLVPRDSDQQALFGRAKNVGDTRELEAGDLLFFGRSADQITHVAMYLSNGLFLHAFGKVRVNALSATHLLFEERLVSDWQGTRDPLSM